jgi:hypothetical protein
MRAALIALGVPDGPTGDFVQVERTDGRVIFRTPEGDPVVEAEAVQMETAG